MRFKKYIISFLLVGLQTTTVEATGPGPYFGLQVGQTNMDNKNLYVNTGLPAKTCDMNKPSTCITTPGKVKPNNKGIGERLFFGVQMNKYAGFEIGATNYAPSVYDPKIPNSNQPAIRGYAFDINLKGMYSLYNFMVFGKVGGVGTRQTATGGLTNVSLHGVKLNQVPKAANSGHLTGAFGFSFDITPNWVVELTASKIFQGSNFPNATFVSVGFSYHWVDLYCGQFLC